MTTESIFQNIENASKVIGTTWPLYSFVTSNPLSGYENLPFLDAVKKSEKIVGGRSFPEAIVFAEALKQRAIDQKILTKRLLAEGMTETPNYYLDILTRNVSQIVNLNQELDTIMVKWLSIFMDEGLAEWEMPNREKGFFTAWRSLAKYDNCYNMSSSEIPKNAIDTLNKILSNYSEQELLQIFEQHIAALPGWTGYIKHRIETDSIWQKKFPISMADYLAVRLWSAKNLNIKILNNDKESITLPNFSKISNIFLESWEQSWQEKFIVKLSQPLPAEEPNIADAQLVSCIDTRSELIRRNIESKGNYETFGYAGFFGIAMDYTNIEDGLTRKSCPPIVGSAYNVVEIPQEKKEDNLIDYKKRGDNLRFGNYFLTRMKNMLPSAFGYVEGSGILYGMSLLSRTLIPSRTYDPVKNNELSHEKICSPKLTNAHDHSSLDISLDEKTAIVKGGFDVMGWKKFSPLVVFAGHGSHSANNPFGSSLDCGACAASPGRHNARMLAKLANDKEVRKSLSTNFNIEIPESTVFIGAEHNTATDEIVLFDSEVPPLYSEKLAKLKADLRKAQQTATNERLGGSEKSVRISHRKANNWAETRPEWGLAKNTCFIIGPRSMTKNIDLEGNCFLQSYDWQTDQTGNVLEAIMQGPMVVTQWINTHYYFATVDNKQFGGGSKITHNITGKFGVVQGNGGDLKIGLPIQSVNSSDDDFYHKPLRLSVIIQAPKNRIEEILAKNANLKMLLDNRWIYLLVMDPKNADKIERYEYNFNWTAVSENTELLESAFM